MGRLPADAVSSTDLKKKDFERFGLTGQWKTFIGDLTVEPFSILMYGVPGSRKSSFVIMFAHYLASRHNKRILYVSAEEGPGATMQIKFKLLNAWHDNIIITRNIPGDLTVYDVIVLDSVNELDIKPKELAEIQKQAHARGTSFIYVFKSVKDGSSARGSLEYEHLVDIVIKLEDGIARNIKNRYCGTGVYLIGTPENVNILKYTTLSMAERARDKTKEKHLIFVGDDSRYWVVSEAQAELLRAKGYHCIDDVKLIENNKQNSKS